MRLEECYNDFGGSYEDAMGRLQSEALVQRFALKFLKDPSYERLYQAMQAEDYREAFRAAHTLKGLCGNLGFLRLGEFSSQLKELLRNEDEVESNLAASRETMEKVTESYQAVVRALEKLQEEVEG